jgi:signal transduction histidine kinase
MIATATPRGRSLSFRLALVLSGAVLLVLLATGIVVNRVVSQGLADELSAADRDRIALVANSLSDLNLDAPGVRRGMQLVLQRIAATTRGRAELVAGDGRVVAAAGRQLGSDENTTQITEAVPGHDASLVISLPRAEPAFLRVFNLTLIIAGVLAVLALLVASVILSDRLTRPLRGVAAAAHELGAGDLSARAVGGPDRESHELADAFNAMAGRLEQSEHLRRRAASDMAHDLATPATVLESQLQAMVDGVVPADREQLERARSAASAMSGVIVQLRELVDAEAAALQQDRAPVAVATLVAEVERTLAPLFREREVALVVTPIAEDLTVDADAGQLARALRNVVTNAAQHTSPRGTVTIGAERADGRALIRVRDEGSGIAAEDLPHIFERFYRADRARAHGEPQAGSGIGLTIARELLRANGGDAWVEATGPTGTSMVLGLPLAAG